LPPLLVAVNLHCTIREPNSSTGRRKNFNPLE
jgi:hypothetical protein